MISIDWSPGISYAVYKSRHLLALTELNGNRLIAFWNDVLQLSFIGIVSIFN